MKLSSRLDTATKLAPTASAAPMQPTMTGVTSEITTAVGLYHTPKGYMKVVLPITSFCAVLRSRAHDCLSHAALCPGPSQHAQSHVSPCWMLHSVDCPAAAVPAAAVAAAAAASAK